MKKLIPILLIVIFVGCSTTTTNIQKVENYNDNKVLETNNSVVRVDEPDMNGVVLGQDERDIDYYDYEWILFNLSVTRKITIIFIIY